MNPDIVLKVHNYKNLDKDKNKEIKYLDFILKKNTYLGILEIDNYEFFTNFFNLNKNGVLFSDLDYLYVSSENNYSFKKFITIGRQIYLNLLIKNKFNKDLADKKIIKFYSKIDWEIGTVYFYQFSNKLKNIELLKLAILKAIILENELLILNDIDFNLNIDEVLEFKSFINKFHQKLTIIIVSSNIALLSSIVDECLVIFDNRVIESGEIKEIIENPLHPITWETVLKSQNLIYDKFYSNFKNLSFDPNKPLFSFVENYILNIDLLLLPVKYKAKTNHFVYSWLYSNLNTLSFIRPKINK